jgi:hypothetical protein
MRPPNAIEDTVTLLSGGGVKRAPWPGEQFETPEAQELSHSKDRYATGFLMRVGARLLALRLPRPRIKLPKTT